MGTNFFLAGNGQGYEGTTLNHIGKRSAAGNYCWHCSRTLCLDGEEGIHLSQSSWFGSCPQCGSSPEDEKRFEKEKPIPGLKMIKRQKSQVRPCCSFSWAFPPDELLMRIDKTLKKPIRDEYNEEYTLEEFAELLKGCPIQYMESIGKNFS